ncbi:MAG: hypothetical protein ABIW32_04175 [Terrimesophilobacter sp.]
MTLTIDPRLPVLWRTPHSVQVGVDAPIVVLDAVTTAHERMLAALAVGLTPEGLRLIGTESGLSAEQVAEFARAITPALATPTPSPHAIVHIDGVGPTVDRLEWRLREAGLEPRRVNAATRHEPAPTPLETRELAVIVGDFVLDPERRGRWLRRDIPHLPIVYGDTSITMGPFVEPGSGPCLYCLELHRTESDAAWPALASQLLSRTSTAQSPFFASEVASLAARWVLSRVIAGAASPSTAVTVSADTGQRSEKTLVAHPDCACQGLTVLGDSDLQENARVSSLPPSGREMPTTTSEVVDVPA